MKDINDFPEMLEKDIDHIADKLLSDFSKDTEWAIQTPIPVERIAENYLGYAIDITDEGMFADPDFLGGINFGDKVIMVNGSIEDQEGRYNFTIAHELGHHCLHKQLFESHADNGEIMCREQREKPLEEVQADYFAATILMPSELVREAFDRCFGDNGPYEMDYRKRHKLGFIAQKVIDAGGFTNVSLTAMTNRLISLKLIEGVGYQSYVRPSLDVKGPKNILKYYITILKSNWKWAKKHLNR